MSAAVIEADAAADVGEQSHHLGEAEMIDEEQNMSVGRVDLVVGRARRRCCDQSGEEFKEGAAGRYNVGHGWRSVAREARRKRLSMAQNLL